MALMTYLVCIISRAVQYCINFCNPNTCTNSWNWLSYTLSWIIAPKHHISRLMILPGFICTFCFVLELSGNRHRIRRKLGILWPGILVSFAFLGVSLCRMKYGHIWPVVEYVQPWPVMSVTMFYVSPDISNPKQSTDLYYICGQVYQIPARWKREKMKIKNKKYTWL